MYWPGMPGMRDNHSQLFWNARSRPIKGPRIAYEIRDGSTSTAAMPRSTPL
jgi:hypothetical protein